MQQATYPCPDNKNAKLAKEKVVELRLSTQIATSARSSSVCTGCTSEEMPFAESHILALRG